MSGQLERFVRDNRQALDAEKPDPAIWEELHEHASKPPKFSLLRLWQRIKGWFEG